jgi:hypothetical protein
MADIEKRRANRLIVMNAIYETSEASENVSVTGQQLMDSLSLSDEELADACNYLKGEHLITELATLWGHLSPYAVNITHRGIKEMERSLQKPSEPTPYFPPALSVIHIEGNVTGSQIQSGSPGATQQVTSTVDLREVSDFLNRLEAVAPELNLPEAETLELSAEIATLKAQAESPKPKKQIIRESLGSVRTILEGAGGNLAATGLLDILQHIHF